MKLAILGGSPLALEAVLRFHDYGAQITWFNHLEENEDAWESLKFDCMEYTSSLGWELLDQKPQTTLSWKEWVENYAAPLLTKIRVEQDIKPYKIVSVTKRYLAPQEEIQGKSRFHDLFRVIFQLNPDEFIKHQKETNPETYEKLSAEFIQSLQSSLEMYEDFDMVLDLRRATESKSIAITGRALGEGRISTDKIFYGHEALAKAPSYIHDSSVRELVVVGSGSLAAQLLLSLEEWLKDIRNRLFIVSTEAEPFEKTIKESTAAVAQRLTEIFNFMENEFENDVVEFQKKLREWQELDDFIQVKKPKPVEPIPRLNYFSGHNVTAIDQLIDKQRVFLTLEKADFREGRKHPENNFLDLKTIGVDQILVASSRKKRSIDLHVDAGEKGFFSITPKPVTENSAYQRDLEQLKGIEDEIFKLFSPVHPH